MGHSNTRNPLRTNFVLSACIVLSMVAHGFTGLIIKRFGPYQFGTALSETTVMVDLTKPTPPQTAAKQEPVAKSTKPPPKNSVQPVQPATAPEPDAPPPAQPAEPVKVQTEHPVPQEPQKPKPVTATGHNQQERYLDADHIFPHQQEKLVYQISLAGIPVGSAQLEASNNQGELRIQSSIRSNSFISTFYQVNDSTDTRLIKGRYLLTRIRQHEGPYVSDTGFNLMYPERKIFWVDRLKKQFNNEKLESLDTLDFVSGFYYLRLQTLKVGDKLTMRLYDGDTTTIVPVSVLRQEQLALPGLRNARTVVVQPRFNESGFFKNNRDLMVWFTDDHYHVPVRIEATTPIGRVAAELVSSERTLIAPPTAPASTVVPADKMQYR